MGIDHPVVLAGMSGDTSPELVAAVSNAGGLGIYGATSDTPEEMAAAVAAIREKTRAPFGLNLLLCFAEDSEIRAALETKPSVLSTSWPRDDQDLKAVFAAAHERGVKVLHMVPAVGDAVRAAEAGADAVIAQGTDGGGHIGLIGTTVIGRTPSCCFAQRSGASTGCGLTKKVTPSFACLRAQATARGDRRAGPTREAGATILRVG